MKTNREAALTYKHMLHSKSQTIFLAKPVKDGFRNLKNIIRVGLFKDKWDELSKLNMDGYNIYMLVNKVDGSTFKSADVTHINALFIDKIKGDWSASDIESFLVNFPIRPHMVTETSPGNYNVYWRVSDVPLDKFTSAQQQLSDKYDANPNVCALNRVLLMPGTINWTQPTKFLVNIVHDDENDESIQFQLFTEKMHGRDISENTSNKSSVKEEVDVQRATGALKNIAADDRKVWVTVGMALKHHFGEAGLQMYKDWSLNLPKYNIQKLERQWNSFQQEGDIPINTIFWMEKVYSNKPLLKGNVESPPVSAFELEEHFVKLSKKVIKYCEEENIWYIFSEGKWKKSAKVAERFSFNYLNAMNKAASDLNNKVFSSFIGTYKSISKAKELLRTAASNSALLIKTNTFDQSPNILPVKLPDVTGAIERYSVVDLSNKKTRLSVSSDNVVKFAGAVYDRTATCPMWMEFISQITAGEDDLAAFLQLVVGYTLYGHANEQIMFILIGKGGNGKGIFSRTIYKLFGEYSVVMQSSLLKPGAISGNSPSPAIMKLNGKRLWLCSEVLKGMVLDEALTKQLTGGDLISSRGLYSNQVEFLPVGKLWLLVNDMPRVRHDDEGMWRRIVPIPFNAVFKGRDRDNVIEGKLQNDELSGILNWALEGARLYAEKGKLELPKASVNLLAALRKDVDTVDLWITSRCVVSDDGKQPSQAAYDDYCETMKREKATPLPQKEFNADLIRHGHEHKKGSRSNFFVGLRIRDSLT
jgi:P4 family phage/plasmid primase-like protien